MLHTTAAHHPAIRTYPRATWRLLQEPFPRAGATHMAIDEAILHAVAAGIAPPTLRIYSWHPPALTLGRGQSHVDADIAALEADQITLLRRATGGTAVLHTDEITYSVAVHEKDPRFAGDIADSYQGISNALLYMLKKIGVTRAETGYHTGQKTIKSPVCFEIPSAYEITVDGRKLVGSSQMRIRGGILQHGSLPLSGDIAKISRYLTERPSEDRIRGRALTLYEALGDTIPSEKIGSLLIEGFMMVLNLELFPGTLLPDERAYTDHLLVEKYNNPEWIKRI
ncbi:MAG: lipoate--protein ligase family protein [Anaerolineae bacterium]|nr:lipoate--protein ligase family protein [Anaerolineae bacterium]